MALSIGEITVGDGAARSSIEDAVLEVGEQAGAEWRLSLTPSAEDRAWDLVVEGPRRRRALDGSWQVLAPGAGALRYERSLHGREQSAGFVRAAVRRLIWEDLDFRDDAHHDAATAAQFEDALWDVLRGYQVPPLTVRLSCWRGDPACLQYVCKVEVDPRFCYGEPQWRWWSALVKTPEQLAEALGAALGVRFPAAGSARSGRAVPRARVAVAQL
jgi:hypothetical protein